MKFQTALNKVASNRDRVALRQIFTLFLTDDDPPKLKDLSLASIILSGTETTQITISGACTTGILLSAVAATPIRITGAFTTGITIAADGTTGISITSAFSGVNMISLAGTGSGAGIAISGACGIGLSITGACTDGIKIATGAQIDGIEIAAACTNAFNLSAMAGITNLFAFNAIAGALVANALVPAAAPDAGTAGADAALKVLIGAVAYYIPLYDTLHA